jgi:hypothetical protein
MCYQIVQALVDAVTGEDFEGGDAGDGPHPARCGALSLAPAGRARRLWVCSRVEAYKYVFES